MASLAPTQPEANASPSLSHHRLCTYRGCAQSLKPGPGVAWSCWLRSQAVVPCGAAAPLTQQPTSASTPIHGVGVGAGAEPHAPSVLTARTRMRRTVLRLSAGPLPSHACSVDYHCLGMGVRSWATSVSLQISPSVASLSAFLCVCLCDVSLWVCIEGVIPEKDGLQKEQNHRLRKIIRICCSLTRFFVSVPSPFPWVLTTDDSEAPRLMKAAVRRDQSPSRAVSGGIKALAYGGLEKAFGMRPPQSVLSWHRKVKIQESPSGGISLVFQGPAGCLGAGPNQW